MSREKDAVPDLLAALQASVDAARAQRKQRAAEKDALAGEVWQEADNVLLLCVEPGKTWQDFNGQRFPWDAPTVARPLRRLLDRAGNLAPEYSEVTP